jgi:hypothetical protein
VAEQFIKEIKDGFAIYSNDVRIVKPVPGESILYQTFRDLFGADASNLAKSHIILVEYKNTGSDETNALEMVKERLQTLDILYDATVVCGCVSVLIFKSNYMAIRQQLNIHDLTPPLVYRLINPKSIGSQAARQKQLDAFVARSKLPSERVCTMHVKNAANIDADTGLSIAEQDLLAQVRSCLSNPASASRFQSALEHLLAEHAARRTR